MRKKHPRFREERKRAVKTPQHAAPSPDVAPEVIVIGSSSSDDEQETGRESASFFEGKDCQLRGRNARAAPGQPPRTRSGALGGFFTVLGRYRITPRERLMLLDVLNPETHGWLNDVIINAFLDCLTISASPQGTAAAPRCLALSSHFMTRLRSLDSGRAPVGGNTSDAARVRALCRWVRGVDLLPLLSLNEDAAAESTTASHPLGLPPRRRKQVLLIPVHSNSHDHWSLIAVEIPVARSGQRGRMVFCDSLRTNGAADIARLRSFLHAAAVLQLEERLRAQPTTATSGPAANARLALSASSPDGAVPAPSVRPATHPASLPVEALFGVSEEGTWIVHTVRGKQENNYDCGVFVCFAASLVVLDGTLDRLMMLQQRRQNCADNHAGCSAAPTFNARALRRAIWELLLRHRDGCGHE